jgi:DNA-directed RNA polymerase specialized sigma24 family protein
MQARPVAAEPPGPPDAIPFEESLASEGSDVPSLAARNERARLVRRALAELTADQQRVIELSYFKGYTRREIARQRTLLLHPEGARRAGAVCRLPLRAPLLIRSTLQ